ncbi:MAG: acetate/propionate family kinase [Planctomycetaceae bacterium]|nr:acetate/propionate family kinase [Planctomycetaceae bacterium]
MRVLTLNAGSSSLKASVIDTDREETLIQFHADWSTTPTTRRITFLAETGSHSDVCWSDVTSAVRDACRLVSEKLSAGVDAVAHRVVHGGTRFTKTTLINPESESVIRELAALAPLHNPRCLEGIVTARQALPQCPHVAVFDTAFHATLLPEAFTYPVPREWTDEWGIRKYGFHGLSHSYAAQRTAAILNRPLSELRIVTAHLGHGASLCAIQSGCSVDTTMGFTPLEGVMMGTRSGSIDPGVVLHIMREHQVSVTQMDQLLNSESGLFGVSGISADIRQVQKAAQSGSARAQLAIDMYVRRVRQAIAGMTASMAGLNALVFTGGIGEHAAEIRQAVCAPLEFLGMRLSQKLNDTSQPDSVISASESRIRILTIAAREDLMLARETHALLQGHQ